MRRRRVPNEAIPLGHYLVLLVAFFCRPSLRAWSITCEPSNTTYLVQSSVDVSILNDAVNCSDGGRVDAIWSGSVELARTILIGTGTHLNVTGEDGAEAVGDFGYRMFRVSSGGTLDVWGVRLTGGTEVEGGAILAENGTVRLENCEVDNNMAIENGGGAIFTVGGELTIIDCSFHNNTALTTSTLGDGGAVLANDTTVTVRGNTRFEFNSGRAGGAIYSCSSISSPHFFVEGTSFVMNELSYDGDIVIDSYDMLWDELFGGGALSLDKVTAEVRDCTFERNSATLSGGALFGTGNTMIAVYGTSFRNNSTPGYGGAVAASIVNFTDSTFKHNNAEHGAGVSPFCLVFRIPPRTVQRCFRPFCCTHHDAFRFRTYCTSLIRSRSTYTFVKCKRCMECGVKDVHQCCALLTSSSVPGGSNDEYCSHLQVAALIVVVGDPWCELQGMLRSVRVSRFLRSRAPNIPKWFRDDGTMGSNRSS